MENSRKKLTKRIVMEVLESMVHTRKTIAQMNAFVLKELGAVVDICDCTPSREENDAMADYDFMGTIDTEEIFCDFDIYVLPTRQYEYPTSEDEERPENCVYYITEVGYEFQ